MASGKIGFLFQFLGIAAINEKGLAAGGMAAIHIAPAVAHHPALGEVNAEFARGTKQHAGFRLAAIAVGHALAGVETDFHPVNGQLCQHVRVDFFNDFLLQSATTNIGLVRGDDEQKAGGLQLRAGGRNFRQNFKFSQARRRIRAGVAFQSPIDDAVAVEKNSAPHFCLLTSNF